MIRYIIENIALFLLPTALYVIYFALMRSTHPATVLSTAPVLWLGTAGAMLVMIVMLAFATNSGGKPGQAYEPAHVGKDGRVEQGRFK